MGGHHKEIDMIAEPQILTYDTAELGVATGFTLVISVGT